MIVKKINIEELNGYVTASFKDDSEIIDYYDKRVDISSWEDAAKNVILKVNAEYDNADFFGVEFSGEKVGYFVKNDGLLISFCLQKQLRSKKYLQVFWSIITDQFEKPFNCVLYSNNSRAIGWLKKCGMQVILHEVTVLNFNICQ